MIVWLVAKIRNIAVPSHTLPSKLDLPATHPALEKSIESQKLKKLARDQIEDEEIAAGQVDTVVYNLQTHIKLIMRLIKATHASLQEYKSESANLRQEIFELRQKLIDENEHVLKEMNPQVLDNYKRLKGHMKAHKDDNEIKYKELLKLKKSISSSQQLLDNEAASLKRLENAILGRLNIEDNDDLEDLQE